MASSVDATMLTIEQTDDLGASAYRDGTWSLLCRIDREFVPPLSARNSPTDVNLANKTAANSTGALNVAEPVAYFKELLAQKTIVALEGDQVAGFLSYRKDYFVPEVEATTDAYVSTVGVAPEMRGRGVSRLMYRCLFDLISKDDRIEDQPVMTRTWTTNASHIKVITDFGFQLIRQIDNGRGEGIHTVLYALPRSALPMNSSDAE